MKKILLIISITSFLLISACAKQPRIFKAPETTEDLSFTPVKPLEWQMPNGLKVVYVEDKELPIVRGALYIPRGTLWEKPSEYDLVSAMGYLLRQGGTENLEPDKLDFQLEKLAASVESGYSSEFGSISFSCLNSDIDSVFPIFADVLLKPKFDESRLDLWKGQMLEAIRRRTDDPSTIASIAYRSLVYGNGSFGRTGVSADIKKINQKDLLRLHKEFVVPNQAYLAVIGNISREKLEETVNKYLSTWQKAETLDSFEPSFSYNFTPGIYFVEQPLEQATIYIGQQGPARLPADYTAIEAFNNIFGSGDFGARLFKKIRTELGLAYSLYGAVLPSFLVGQNIIVIQTKSESASQATVESLKILKEMQLSKVTEEELELSKKTIKNSFIFKIDSPDDAVKRYIMLKMLKYPDDYDSTYFEKTNKVSLSDIKDAAAKYWDLNKLVIVVVGNQKAYNAFKNDLDKNLGSLYNLKLQKCSFDEILGKCI